MREIEKTNLALLDELNVTKRWVMREIEKQTSLYNKQPCCTWLIKCYQKISDARDRKKQTSLYLMN